MTKEIPKNKFIAASEKMTSSWKKIAEAKQIDFYRNLSREEAEALIKGNINKIPEEKRNIAEYLRALNDFLKLSK